MPKPSDLVSLSPALFDGTGVDVRVLCVVMDAFDQAAYLVSDDGALVHANPRACAQFGKPPGWLGTLTDPDQCAGLTRFARIRPIAVGRNTHWLVLPRTTVELDVLDALPQSLRSVAALLAAGLSDKAIARRLGRPLPTVRTYVARVYRRLGIRSRAELSFRIKHRSST